MIEMPADLGLPDGCHVPWRMGEWWHGSWLSIDGTPAGEFGESDVAEVVAYEQTAVGWDGSFAGVVRLKDGRFAAWSGEWGPTGSGFSADAYGGDTDVYFAASVAAVLTSLDERGLDLLADLLPDEMSAAHKIGGAAAVRIMFSKADP